MCRMLGIVASSGIDGSLLREFRALSKTGRLKGGSRGEHPDGWGIAYFAENQPNYAGRRPKSAWLDLEEYERACREIDEKRPRMIVAHLRKASLGGCSLENTHPFIKDGWCFAHNGTIYYRKEELADRIDSERFFDDIMAGIDGGKGVVDAIRDAAKVARELRNERGERSTSLTFLMADGASLYAYREYSMAPEYYTMYYNLLPEMAVAAQETEWLAKKMPGVAWRELENRELLVVDAAALRAKRVRFK